MFERIGDFIVMMEKQKEEYRRLKELCDGSVLIFVWRGEGKERVRFVVRHGILEVEALIDGATKGEKFLVSGLNERGRLVESVTLNR